MNRLLKALIVIILGAGAVTGCTRENVPEQTPDGKWTLVWHDEFRTFDKSKWNHDIGNGFMHEGEYISGWGNNELEYYTDRRKNCYVKNGVLHIRALEEEITGDAGGQQQTFDYTSARIHTKGKFAKKYGRFEIRARLPYGKGLWPAIWLLPEENVYGNWAASGEIDIMEARGSDLYKVHGTIHYGGEWPANASSTAEYVFPFTDPPQDIGTWHVYALEWEPGVLRWYVDDTLYSTKRWWNSENNPYPAPFDQEFHIIMNLAVGGHYDGDPNESTEFPAEMEVDYVRVYDITGGEYPEAVMPDLSEFMDPRPDDARAPTDDGNEVYNSSFTMDDPQVEGVEGVAGTDYWYFLHLPAFGGEGTLSIENIDGTNYAKIDITEPGNQYYSVQLIQDVPLIKGHPYRVTFECKAEADREIMVKISGDESRNWVSYSPVKVIDVGPEMREYKFDFTMTEDTDINARFEFNVGTMEPDVWIGKVRLEDQAPEL